MRGAPILLGLIGRPHGVRGLVRVTSYADPPEAIADYGPLACDAGRRFVLRWRGDGIAEIASVVSGVETRIADRDAAARLTNTRLYVERDRLPAPADDEFYLADLVGLAAVDAAGTSLGTVAAVHDYGAGASLEIEGTDPPLVVPFTRAAVPVVDVEGGRVVVAPPSPSRGAGEVKRQSTSSPFRERSARACAPGEGRPPR